MNMDFSSFLYNSFYSKFSSLITAFLVKHRDELSDRFFDGKTCYDVEVEDFEIKKVSIERMGEGRISFDVVVVPDASLEVKERGDYQERQEIGTTWITLSCQGDIFKKLADFRITFVDFYNGKCPSKKPLDQSLVPYIKKEEYDKYANEILDKYYPKSLGEKGCIVDPLVLVKRMGLSLIERTITSDSSTFGQYYFESTKVSFFDPYKNEAYLEEIPAHTIVIDPNANNFYSLGSKAITILHECVHAFLHELAFRFEKMINGEVTHIECQRGVESAGGFSNETLNYMECQANGIAPKLLLQTERFVSEAKREIAISHQIGYNDLEYMPSVIDSLAAKFGVTVYSIRKRLIELGFNDAIGAKNWIDGSYLRPYKFENGSLKANESFSLSSEDLEEKLTREPSFFQFFYKGNFRFVENHICLNSEKYVRKGICGDYKLTDYARNHMDECCIKVSCHTKNFTHFDSSFVNACYLCRNCGVGLSFDVKISDNSKLMDGDNAKEVMQNYSNEIKQINSAICGMTLPEAFTYLMKLRGLSQIDLAVACDLDKKTVERYVKGINKEPDLRTVIALCRGLELYPKNVETIFKIAGVSFQQNNPEQDILQLVVIYMGDKEPEYVNKYLMNLGYEPLTKKKK